MSLRERWRWLLLNDPVGLRDRVLSLPEEQWNRDGTLLLALASAYRECADTHPFALVPYLDAAAESLTAVEIANGIGVLVGLAQAASHRDRGQTVDALESACASLEALDALDSLPLTSRIELQARVMFETGMCLMLIGELDVANMHLCNGLGLWNGRPADSTVIEALGCLAIVEYFAGSASSPVQRISEARDLAASAGLADRACLGAALVAEIMVAIDDGALERAEKLLAAVEPRVSGTPYELLHLHCVAVLDGWKAGPLEQLERLAELQLALRRWQTPSLVCSLHDSTRILTLMQVGSVSAARDAVEALPPQRDDDHALCSAWLAARLALHTGEYETVLAITADCRALGDNHAPRSLAFVNAVRSAAHEALGDLGNAAETIDRALLQAKRSGWRRHLTTLPPDLLDSMLAAARTRPQSPGARSVLDDLSGAIGTEAAGSIQPLSSRERLVLSHLMDGLTRQQISSRLRVSPNTVKSQTRSIYRKLGAANKHEAVDRAAKFGISS